MELWQIVLLAGVVLVGAPLFVLYRRQRLSRAGDSWTPGQHRPHTRDTDSQPHSDGGGTGAAGVSGGGF